MSDTEPVSPSPSPERGDAPSPFHAITPYPRADGLQPQRASGHPADMDVVRCDRHQLPQRRNSVRRACQHRLAAFDSQMTGPGGAPAG